MLLNRINIQNALIKEKEDQLLAVTHELLDQAQEKDGSIKRSLLHYSSEDGSSTVQHISIQDQEYLFSPREIKVICIKYRLRFLDSQLFKNEIPYEALIKVKEFEKRNNVKITKFKILAPKDAFKLNDRNKDPLLFAQLSDNTYYLLHKWGNDLAWYKAILAYPLRNFFTFFHTILAIALFIACCIPQDFLVRNEDFYKDILYYRMYFFAWSSIALFFTLLYLGFSFHKNFSDMEWNSKYFN